jgi:hypothetical protein
MMQLQDHAQSPGAAALACQMAAPASLPTPRTTKQKHTRRAKNKDGKHKRVESFQPAQTN